MQEEKKEEEKKVERRPQAKKRDIQSEKRRMDNRAFRARVSTAIRTLESAISKKEADVVQKLGRVHSLVDKGVKTGVYKINKASRMKSKLTLKTAAK